jgi:SAM-dependent methyltransferase
VQTGKYYDWKNRRALNVEDGCPLDQWLAAGTDSSFGIHPRGFPVFLGASEICLSDEYSDGDPYLRNAEAYLQSPFHRRRRDCTLRLIKESRREAQTQIRICDLGCGKGQITAAIRQLCPNDEISGLDYSLSAIAEAAEAYKGIDFVVANAYEPPYCPAYFDVVVCNNIWEHVPDPMRLLQAISRILRDDGCLIMSTPSRYRLCNLLRVLLGKPVTFMSDHHVTEYTVGQVIEQLRFGGFETKVVSAALRRPYKNLRSFAAFGIAMPLLRLFLKAVGSHHSLEETVFYLGKRQPKHS